MCGICGIIEKDGCCPPKSLLKKMSDIIAVRGPDDAGVYIQQNIGFGHRRLSILDLSAAGHQPYISDDGRKVLTYNGEIYNYRELRDSMLVPRGYKFKSNCDTEVLLKMYEEFGVDCLQYFRRA